MRESTSAEPSPLREVKTLIGADFRKAIAALSSESDEQSGDIPVGVEKTVRRYAAR